ncbi:MAG: hypothetical protein EBT75_11165, partial [Proteobacteria bacterium]|nr:hypothetical protein [Pseudomonadota bacterium]
PAVWTLLGSRNRRRKRRASDAVVEGLVGQDLELADLLAAVADNPLQVGIETYGRRIGMPR